MLRRCRSAKEVTDPCPTRPLCIRSAEAFSLHSLITPTEQGIASRIVTKTSGGSLTLFAFDAGQGLSEHTSPFDAIVVVLKGTFALTVVESPSVQALETSCGCLPMSRMRSTLLGPAGMLLMMLRDQKVD